MPRFPFGWIRDFGGDNWQVLWCPDTGVVFLKAAKCKRVIDIGRASGWLEAKRFAQAIVSEPSMVAERLALFTEEHP
jgi:hypothetical protein